MTNTFYSDPVGSWRQVIDESDYEHTYQNTFGAIIANIMNLVFPEVITKPIMTVLADLLLSSDQADFLIHTYLPILFDATKDVHVPISKSVGLLSKGIGVIIKIGYAFLF